MSPLLSGALLALQGAAGGWQEAPPLPRPVTDNAVAAVQTAEGATVLSFLGRADGGSPEPVDWAFRWEVGSERWSELGPVPGPPRLAAAAESVRGRVYLFGGRRARDDGSVVALDRVDVYDPVTDGWSVGAPLPVAVRDAVSGVWRDSLVYLVGGGPNEAGEQPVLLYDPVTDRWTRATPVPAVAVSGHAGAVARDALVYVDGVRVAEGDEGTREEGPESAVRGGRPAGMQGSAWRGDIDPRDPTHVTWRRLPPHPGPPRYRAVAAAVGTRIVVLGGSDGPYDRDGPERAGPPPEPVGGSLVYDLVTGAWSRATGPPEPALTHGALVRAGGWLVVPGGMTAGRIASDRVWRIPVLELVAGGR